MVLPVGYSKRCDEMTLDEEIQAYVETMKTFF